MSTTYKLITTTFPREEYSLKTGAYRLGSASDNEIILEDASVAGHHCELVVTANTMTLRNLSPNHETFVNDQKIDSAQLESGQSIQLGNVKLLLEADVTDLAGSEKAGEPIRIAAASIAKAKAGLSKPFVRVALLGLALLALLALLYVFWPASWGKLEWQKTVASQDPSEAEPPADSETNEHAPAPAETDSERSFSGDGGPDTPVPNLSEQPKAYNANETNRPINLDVEAAELHIQRGGLRLAVPFLKRALRNAEKSGASETLTVTTVLSTLGNLYRNLRDNETAKPLLERVLNNAQRAPTVDPVELAQAENNLGELLLAEGDPEEAAPLLEKALEARKAELKPGAPEIGVSLNNVAALHAAKGDYAKAKPLLEEALNVFEDHFGPMSSTVAQAASNLGELHRAMGEPAAAAPLLKRALEIKEKTLPPEDASLATTLNSLAAVHEAQGKYKDAEPLRERALAITEKAVGRDHPDTAASLENLAGLYAKMLKTEKAAPLLDRSVKISEKALGPNHPQSISALRDHAALERCQGDQALGMRLTKEALERSYTLLGEAARFASREVRIEMLNRLSPCDLAVALGSGKDIAESVLRYKGLIVDSLIEDRLILDARDGAKTKEMVRALEETRTGLTELLFAIPNDFRAEATDRRLAESETLTTRLGFVERALKTSSDGIGNVQETLTISLEDIQGKLGSGAVLVEFIRYTDCPGSENQTYAYGAVAIASKGEPRWIPLGSAKAIEELLLRYQQETQAAAEIGIAEKQSTASESLNKELAVTETPETPNGTAASHNASPEDSLGQLLKELYQQVWNPVEAALPEGTKSVIICPDAGLNLLSFAVLVDDGGHFLTDRHSVYYVSAGRDLLKKRKSSEKGPVLIFGNPDFTVGSLGGTESPRSDFERLDEETRRDLEELRLPKRVISPQEIALVHFYATKGKDQAILFMGPKASEAELLALKDSKVVHLGTRGFVLASSETQNGNSGQGSAGRLEPFYGPTFEKTPVHGMLMAESPELFAGIRLRRNPLHRSGVLLAGAGASLKAWKRDQVPDLANDGIMTSDDLARLKWDGTALVVISACETGIGSFKTGDGILALRRAFIQTGAEDLLIALSSAGNDTSAKMLGEFYGRYRELGDAPLAFSLVQRDWMNRLRAEKGLREAVTSVGSFVMNASGSGQ